MFLSKETQDTLEENGYVYTDDMEVEAYYGEANEIDLPDNDQDSELIPKNSEYETEIRSERSLNFNNQSFARLNITLEDLEMGDGTYDTSEYAQELLAVRTNYRGNYFSQKALKFA